MGMFRTLKNLIMRASHYVGEDAWLKMSPNDPALNRPIAKDEALTLSAVWRGINVLSNTVANLPINVFNKLPGGGKEENSTHPLFWVLRYRPNSLQDRFQFFQMMMVHLLLRGNFYAQIIRNGRNDIYELYPLNPELVRPKWEKNDDESSLVYEVSLPKTGKNYILKPEQMLHIRAIAICGVEGISAVTMAARSVGIGLAQEEHTASFFGRGTRATGVLTHPSKLSKEAADRIKQSFEQNFSGPDNAYRTILLEEGMTWNSVSLNAEQSQLTASRAMSVAEFARWLGVPPHMLYDLSRATFSNIEHQGLEYFQNSVQAWVTAIECAIVRQCIPEKLWNSLIVQFNIDGILRSDILARYQAYNIGRNAGFLNVDEIRAKENMNPLPGGKGQIYLEPLNMKEAGTDPESEQSPSTDKTDTEDDEMTETETKAWRNIFSNRITRALRREEATKQRDNFDADKFNEYLDSDFKGDVESLVIARGGNFSADEIAATTMAALHEFIPKWHETNLQRDVTMRTKLLTDCLMELTLRAVNLTKELSYE